MRRDAGALLLLATLLPMGAARSPASAQSVEALAGACATAGGADPACVAMGVAARALVGHVGLAAGPGSEVAGTASNLGQRLGSAPRLAIAARVGAVDAAMPDLATADGRAGASFLLPAAHLDVSVGLFDGFRLAPTVGGVLSVDVFGRAGVLLLPGGEGFDGRVTAYSIGARVGVFRESFTLPGLSVSVARRFLGDVGLGDASAGGAARVDLEPSVTSVRAAIGKNVVGVEVFGGVGWDDHSADVAYRVSDGLGGAVTGQGGIDASRTAYFVGVATTLRLVLSLSAEVGFADGFDPVPAYAGADFDPGRRSLFGSLAFRLTL